MNSQNKQGWSGIGVVWWLRWPALIVMALWSPGQRRVLSLKASLLIYKLKIACHAPLARLELESKIFVLLCQNAYLRLKLRYLLLKRRFVVGGHGKDAK